MLFFLCKLLKKASAVLKSELLSSLYKKAFLFLLERKLGFDTEFYQKYNIKSSEELNNVIWVYWGQGFNNAPPVVQNCLESLLRNKPGDYQVITLDDATINSYITVPDIINNHLANGTISRTHYSDIVRFQLLKQYGGIWIDSTILVSENFHEILNDYRKFITLKHNNHNAYTSVTDGKWTSYFIGMPKDNPLARFMCDAYIIYWKRYNKVIDYVLIDYLIALSYKRIPVVQSMINEDKKLLGNSRWLLQEIYEEKISSKYDNILESDSTKIYKLSYKIEPPLDKNSYYFKYFIGNDKLIGK